MAAIGTVARNVYMRGGSTDGTGQQKSKGTVAVIAQTIAG